MTPDTLHPALAKAIADRGYETLTPVQQAMLDPANGGADLLVSAQTGSGKTVAFGMAIAPTLLGPDDTFEDPGLPLGLVIAPTRELALQVRRELDWLYAGAGVVTTSCVGGMDQRTERRALERGAHIVVGTPGRLRDHITRGALDLSAARAVILDEADEMLDLGFREDLEFILAAAPEERRTLMFSATVPRAIADLAQNFQRDARRLTVNAAAERHADIDYQLMLVQKEDREHAVINTLLETDSAATMVFCHTREAVKHLAARLGNRGFAVVALSGELTQAERTSALQAMRNGRASVCVATDVAARGIDLPNLDLVIHADMPSNPDTLKHRSGRTGRAGRKGVCVLVVPVHRRAAALRVLRSANLDATVRSAPTVAEIEVREKARLLERAATTPMPEPMEAELVEEILAVLAPQQLAAAWLRLQAGNRPAPEELSDLPVHLDDRKPRERDRERPAPGTFPSLPPGERPGREVMEGGVWFTLSLGRKHRADPKWLLPMLCKAGGLGRRDIGSIKIFQDETRFEVAGDKAAEFVTRTSVPGALESGVRITPAERMTREGKPFSRPRPPRDGDAPRPPRAQDAASAAGDVRPPRPPRQPSADDAPWAPRQPETADAPRPRPEASAADAPPKWKVRSDRGADLGVQPATGPAQKPGKPKPDWSKSDKPRSDKPRSDKPRTNPKDKGKPKYKARPAGAEHAGDKPRKKPRPE
jgi:ATP-dependent RNA helicase DeaD